MIGSVDTAMERTDRNFDKMPDSVCLQEVRELARLGNALYPGEYYQYKYEQCTY